MKDEIASFDKEKSEIEIIDKEKSQFLKRRPSIQITEQKEIF